MGDLGVVVGGMVAVALWDRFPLLGNAEVDQGEGNQEDTVGEDLQDTREDENVKGMVLVRGVGVGGEGDMRPVVDTGMGDVEEGDKLRHHHPSVAHDG